MEEEFFVYLVHQGCDEARMVLYNNHYMRLLKNIRLVFSNSYSVSDHSDYLQLLIITFDKCVEYYRCDSSCKFSTFVAKSVKNSIYSILRKLKKTNELNKKSISLNQCSRDGGLEYQELVKDNKSTYSPRDQLIVRELQQVYNTTCQSQLTEIEKQVTLLSLRGYSCEEIAEIIGVNLKKIYNTKYRINKKLAKLKSI